MGATQTIWLRAAYAVPGRLPRCQVTLHAVSEMVAVDVPVLTDAEAPVVLRATRQGTRRDVADAAGHAAWMGGAHVASLVQRLEVREGPDGPLCPVFGPDAATHLSVEDLPRATAETAAMHAAPRRGALKEPPAWGSYPGMVPCGLWGWSGKPLAPEPGHPNVPVWAAPDMGQANLRDVGQDVRSAELSAFRRRVAGLAVVGGRLWTPCDAPVVARRYDDATSDLVLPLRDGDVSSDADMHDYVAVCDLADRAALGDAVRPSWRIEALAPLARRHDVTRTNLLLLPRLVDRALYDAAWRGVHEEVRPLLGLVAGLRRDLARGDADPERAERLVLGEAVRVLGELAPMAPRMTRSMGALLVQINEWSKVTSRLRERAPVPTVEEDEAESDPLVAGLVL